MILENVHVTGLAGKKNIRVEEELIIRVTDSAISPAGAIHEMSIDCKGAFAFPGLINSHDHLDFNLFPSLKNKVYTSYTEWGADIHRNNKETIGLVQKVPPELRMQWGVYKNLLNGITTVVNHGRIPVLNEALITIFQDCYDLHSPRFEKHWKLKLNRLFRSDRPFVIHLGEGTDADAENEINEVIQANFFKRRIIAVHGVAMTARQAGSFAGLVWCPQSNYFLLDKTCNTAILKKILPVVFGSDSTLTSSWNFWDHLRCGLKTGMVEAGELFEMITSVPAKLWGLENSGRIEENYTADLVIARAETGKVGIADFFNLEPEDILLVMQRGKIRVLDERMLDQLPGNLPDKTKFSRIQLKNTKKYVEGDLVQLLKDTRNYYPDVNIPFTVL